MINSLNSVLTIFIMIGIGYYLTKKGFFSEETSRFFSRLVIRVSLPLMMIISLYTKFTKEELLGSFTGIGAAFINIISTFLISMIIARLIRLDKSKRGVFYAMFTFSNTIFIGLPINISLYGEESAPYVFLFYISSTILFWTLGVYNIRRTSSNKNTALSFRQTLKMIFSPPFMGFLIGLTLVLFQISLPKFILDSFKYIGNLTTPLSMFFIGIVIHNIDFKAIKLDLSSYMILLGRFVIAPALMLFFISFFDLPILLNKVLVIEASMPIITQAALIADYYNADSKNVAVMVSLSTILSLFVVPIYAFILQLLF